MDRSPDNNHGYREKRTHHPVVISLYAITHDRKKETVHIYSTLKAPYEDQYDANKGTDSLTKEVAEIRGAVYSDCIAATEAVVESAVIALNNVLEDFNGADGATLVPGKGTPTVLAAVHAAVEELNTITDRQYGLKVKVQVVRKHEDDEVAA